MLHDHNKMSPQSFFQFQGIQHTLKNTMGHKLSEMHREHSTTPLPRQHHCSPTYWQIKLSSSFGFFDIFVNDSYFCADFMMASVFFSCNEYLCTFALLQLPYSSTLHTN